MFAVLAIGLVSVDAMPTLRSNGDAHERALAAGELTAPKAIVLGVVEGVTEFLPISSTGHLLVSQRLMDVGTRDATKGPADAYAIAIQAGAILAVLLLYWRRLLSMLQGVFGRSESGRRVLVGVIAAAAPVVVVALLFEKKIKERLLEPGPVIVAWLIGGLLLLYFARRWDENHDGTALDDISLKQASIIGLAQVLSLWPGTSRSLITIVAGLAIGLTLGAAVEFSFVLGFVTLGGATCYELLKDGPEMFETYGVVNPAIGLVVAFASAAIAIKWMVAYLQRHSLAIFGYYRISVAAVTGALMVLGTI